MSYFNKNSSNSPFVAVKLTEFGRKSISTGTLNFTYWGIGDSEINYQREAIVDSNQSSPSLSGSSRIMRPADQQPNLTSFITSGGTDNLNLMNQSNINVIQAIINNQATERGFFSGSSLNYTTLTGDTYCDNTMVIVNSSFTGGTAVIVPNTTNINTGDLMLVKLTNNTVSGFTLNGNTVPIPHLWFKIQAINGTQLTVDRFLPNYSAQTTSNSELLFYPAGEVWETFGNDSTTAYWDSGTLSFDSATSVSCSDVKVWNQNSVWSENPAGLTGVTTTNLYEDYTKFGSYDYLGSKNPYFQYLNEDNNQTTGITNNCGTPGSSYRDDISKSIAILHYSNNVISNVYGETFFIDTTNNKNLVLTMPDLMYHRFNYATGSGITMGMRFIANSGTTKTLGTSQITYYDLIEDVTLVSDNTPKVVGKVFPQFKQIVIDNDELVIAMSYKGNRNWTLPELAANLIAPTSGSTGLLQTNETIYISYSLENNSGTGLTTSISCQDYIKIDNNTSGPKDINVKISDIDMFPYMRKIESAGYDGLGFYAHQFKIIYQIVTNSNDRPVSDAWQVYDFTNTAITVNTNETIKPTLLEQQTFTLNTIVNSAATQFDITIPLGMAPNTNPNILQFGDERFYYGNIATYIGATVFKTIFDLQISSGLYKTTTNSTRSLNPATNPPNIKISEVGIYDNNRNLVVIGKLSTPVPLIAGNSLLLELSLDF